MKRSFAIVFFFCIAICCNAQRITTEQYIKQYKDIAISEMKRSGVPAAITLAQGLLESESGNSDLVKRSNNHFGIKCKNNWTGASVFHDDDARGECFRAYPTAEESFRDHSNFLKGSARYSDLFKLDATDYQGWANGLKKAGYATNPLYPAILIKNIEQYNLQQYSLKAISEMQPLEEIMADSTAKVSVMPEPDNNSKDSAAGTVLDVQDKVITINNCRCVYASKGLSLLFIASKNNINLNRLLEYNEMGEDGILGTDQFIFLQKKSKTGDKDYYIVQDGEEIYEIAQKNGIQLQYLLDYNGLKDGDKAVAGSKLFLKPGLRTSREGKINKDRIHVVAANEGLYSIARKYHVSMEQLKKWNNLSSDELKRGQQLIVSK